MLGANLAPTVYAHTLKDSANQKMKIAFRPGIRFNKFNWAEDFNFSSNQNGLIVEIDEVEGRKYPRGFLRNPSSLAVWSLSFQTDLLYQSGRFPKIQYALGASVSYAIAGRFKHKYYTGLRRTRIIQKLDEDPNFFFLNRLQPALHASVFYNKQWEFCANLGLLPYFIPNSGPDVRFANIQLNFYIFRQNRW